MELFHKNDQSFWESPEKVGGLLREKGFLNFPLCWSEVDPYTQKPKPGKVPLLPDPNGIYISISMGENRLEDIKRRLQFVWDHHPNGKTLKYPPHKAKFMTEEKARKESRRLGYPASFFFDGKLWEENIIKPNRSIANQIKSLQEKEVALTKKNGANKNYRR